MVYLERFNQQIKVAEKTIAKRAYKMDDHAGNDMRRAVGLQTCHCCDYFNNYGDLVVLIEETHLMERFKNIKAEEYPYLNKLNENEKDDFAKKQLTQRNILKIYGSLLVLCRLAAKDEEVEGILKGKPYVFWLAASGTMNSGEKVILQNLRNRLYKSLRSTLGKAMVNEVEVFPSGSLEQKICEYEATP